MDLRLPIVVVAFGALWWLLAGADAASWVVGLPTVAAAAWAVRRLQAGWAGSVSVLGLLRFVPFFVRESLHGGVDVALRTLSPTMRVRPGFTVFRTELRRDDAIVFLVTCANLLPGTLATDLHEDKLNVHLIDAEAGAEDGLRRLEREIGRIFPGSLLK